MMSKDIKNVINKKYGMEYEMGKNKNIINHLNCPVNIHHILKIDDNM